MKAFERSSKTSRKCDNLWTCNSSFPYCSQHISGEFERAVAGCGAWLELHIDQNLLRHRLHALLALCVVIVCRSLGVADPQPSPALTEVSAAYTFPW